MHIREALEEIVSRDSRLGETAASMLALHEMTSDIRFQGFFEPLSAVVIEGNSKRLLDVRAEDVAAWVHHIATSMCCRMRALEMAILENLTARRTLAAMALLRSHFEAAAMATYCLAQLTDAARSDDPLRLATIIPQTLSGTGLKKFRGKHAAGDLLSLCEGDTIQICKAVESMDKFYYQNAARGDLSVVYSLLCDFSHPNHRGVLGFMKAEEQPNGWLISYVKDEPPDDQMTVHAIETLLVSMRAGYSASELLRSWHLSERDGGGIDWRGPSPDDANRVWVRFLQRRVDESVV